MNISTIIYSFDRAMQLDATLKSFFLHCHEAEYQKIDVLYKVSNDLHLQQYKTLIKEYETKKNVSFHFENNFRQDTLQLTNPFHDSYSSKVTNFYDLVIHLHNNLMSAIIPFSIHCNDFILFLVDDNIFVRDFFLLEAINVLSTNLDACGLSLRLGVNTTFCYTLRKEQSLPKFLTISNGFLKFNWTTGDSDFGYPLEISSSIYRVKDIVPLIYSISFSSPNSLEGHLAQKAKKLQKRLPYLLCFNKSVAFCNPINKVQEENNNLFGINYHYSSDKLAELFSNGYRIDVHSYNNFLPRACHQEVKLNFIKRY